MWGKACSAISGPCLRNLCIWEALQYGYDFPWFEQKRHSWLDSDEPTDVLVGLIAWMAVMTDVNVIMLAVVAGNGHGRVDKTSRIQRLMYLPFYTFVYNVTFRGVTLNRATFTKG
jgi:hypothetical protein